MIPDHLSTKCKAIRNEDSPGQSGTPSYYLYQGPEIRSPSSCDSVCPVFLHPCPGPEDMEAGLEEEQPFPAYSGPGWLHLMLQMQP